MSASLPRGPLSPHAIHLCIDMQHVFAEETPWHSPWMKRILPQVVALTEHHPRATIFTRFMPPLRAHERPGMWRHYFERWQEFTLQNSDLRLFEIVDELRRAAPEAMVLDKPAYSPFHGTPLLLHLRQQRCDTVVLSGTETDVCVLAAVLDAVDIGLRVVVANDAICGSSDTTHEAMQTFFHTRLHEQVESADVETILRAWPRNG